MTVLICPTPKVNDVNDRELFMQSRGTHNQPLKIFCAKYEEE